MAEIVVAVALIGGFCLFVWAVSLPGPAGGAEVVEIEPSLDFVPPKMALDGPPGLLGMRPSRNFKIYRREFPAIFRFNGVLFQEFFDIDNNETKFLGITEEAAKRWLLLRDNEVHLRHFKDGYPLCWDMDQDGEFEGSYDEKDVTCPECPRYLNE